MQRLIASLMVLAALGLGAGGMYAYRLAYPHPAPHAVTEPAATAAQVDDVGRVIAFSRNEGAKESRVLFQTFVAGIEQVRKELGEARATIQAIEQAVRDDAARRDIKARLEALERWKVQPATRPRPKPVAAWDTSVLLAPR